MFPLRLFLSALLVFSLFAGAPIANAQELDVDFGEEFGDMMDENGEFSAQTTAEEEAMIAGALAAYFGFIVCMSIVSLVLSIYIAYSLYDALNTVPVEHRELEPWVPWLIFIPVVGIVVYFLGFIKTPKSLEKALNATGSNPHGDCGGSNGLWGMILCVIGCTAPIGIVLVIMSLLKINKAKQTLRQQIA